MYSTAYYSKADWNDTRFFNEGFDKMLFAARVELDTEPSARRSMPTWAMLMRDEGGLITPMFNDFIDATGPQGRRLDAKTATRR